MTDNKDNDLKSFLKENTKSELNKPVNEFSNILNQIEKKPFNIFKIPNWGYAATAVLVTSLFIGYSFNQSAYSPNDEQLMLFLTSSLDDSLYEDDASESATLLSLLEQQ